ncbi:MAG: hypothetical protein KatS3mg015_2615 [Fimbriimonadales bacterium]|nr:MAG: hypothetical protein KatS3mg015_2615 [Fimbriimonadales bacterium]
MATTFTRNPSSNLVLSSGGTVVTANADTVNAYVVATPTYALGKRYVEFKMLNAHATEYSSVGLAADADSTSWLGAASGNGIGLWGDGAVYLDGDPIADLFSGNIATNDIIQLAVDLSLRRLWFGVNNTWYGSPADGTGGITSMPSGALGPAACPYRNNRSIQLKAAASDLVYTPPTGFIPWGTTFRFDGTVRDDSNSPFATTVRAFNRATGVLYASTTSNASTGEFTLYLPDDSEFDLQVMYPTSAHNDKFYARCSPYEE